MKYTDIVFDVDGTLVDTDTAILCSLQKALIKEEQMYINLDELAFVLGIPGTVALDLLGIANKEEVLKVWDELYSDYSDEMSIYEGIEETLKCLSSLSLKLGIVTSRPRFDYDSDEILRHIKRYFHFVVCKESTIKHKPNPEPLLKYLECTGSNPKYTLYVGDTNTDMMCATAAGVDFAYALWNRRNTKIAESLYCLDSPMHLMQILDDRCD